MWVSYGLSIGLFCSGYFPIQKVINKLKPFVYKALQKHNTFKVQIRYNGLTNSINRGVICLILKGVKNDKNKYNYSFYSLIRFILMTNGKVNNPLNTLIPFSRNCKKGSNL